MTRPKFSVALAGIAVSLLLSACGGGAEASSPELSTAPSHSSATQEAPPPPPTPAEALIAQYPDGDPAQLTVIADSTSCDDLQGEANAANAGFEAHGSGTPAGDKFFAHFMAAGDRLMELSCPGW